MGMTSPEVAALELVQSISSEQPKQRVTPEHHGRQRDQRDDSEQLDWHVHGELPLESL
jgi:hypothetical protein